MEIEGVETQWIPRWQFTINARIYSRKLRFFTLLLLRKEKEDINSFDYPNCLE